MKKYIQLFIVVTSLLMIGAGCDKDRIKKTDKDGSSSGKSSGNVTNTESLNIELEKLFVNTMKEQASSTEALLTVNNSHESALKYIKESRQDWEQSLDKQYLMLRFLPAVDAQKAQRDIKKSILEENNLNSLVEFMRFDPADEEVLEYVKLNKADELLMKKYQLGLSLHYADRAAIAQDGSDELANLIQDLIELAKDDGSIIAAISLLNPRIKDSVAQEVKTNVQKILTEHINANGEYSLQAMARLNDAELLSNEILKLANERLEANETKYAGLLYVLNNENEDAREPILKTIDAADTEKDKAKQLVLIKQLVEVYYTVNSKKM